MNTRCIILLFLLNSSCNYSKTLYSEIEKYVQLHKKDNGCPVRIKDIMWFKWDKMKFEEIDDCIKLNFINHNKVVYTYHSYSNSENKIEFGFGEESLLDEYTPETANFYIEVNEKRDLFKTKIYFILPIPTRPRLSDSGNEDAVKGINE